MLYVVLRTQNACGVRYLNVGDGEDDRTPSRSHGRELSGERGIGQAQISQRDAQLASKPLSCKLHNRAFVCMQGDVKLGEEPFGCASMERARRRQEGIGRTAG